MSDLWTLATVDHDAEEHRARIEAAYMASAPLWPFLAASTSVPDYDNRREMLADRLEMAVLGSLGTDTQHFLATLDGLDQRLAQDFTVLDEQREALCKGRVGPLEAAYRRQGLSATAARAEALLAAHSSRRSALEVGANTTLTAAPRGWALLVLGHKVLSYDDDTFVVHQVDAQKVPLQLVQARLNAWLPEGYTVTRDGNRLAMHRTAGGMDDPYSRGKAQDAASGGVPDPYTRKAKCHNTERSKDGTCTACGTKSDKTPHALGPWLKRSSFVRIAVSWGRRHYEDLASFISQHDEPERSHLAAHFADRLIGTNPNFHPDQFRKAATTPGYIPRNGTGGADYTQGHMEHLADTVRSYPGDQHMLADHLATRLQTANPRFKRSLFMNRALGDSAPAKAASRKLSVLDVLATVFTAEEHGGYHIEQDGGKWKVVNHIGEVKSTFDSHEKALEYQRALMVNVPGAKEDAERHEENDDKGKHSSRRHLAYDREPVTHLTYTGPYAGHPLCGDKREGDNGVHAAYAPESFFEHGHVDERHGTKVCPNCQAIWNEPESHEPGSEQMSLFSSFREVTHSRHVAAGPIMDPRGGVPSGMNSREKAEFLKNQPWKATHTFEPIGWDRFDSRPHPGSKPIAAGSPVMNHGQMSPKGPGGMTLWHVSDEQGNHQTVDKRSLKSLRKGKQSALDTSWLDGFDAGRSLAQGGGQLPVRRLASLGLYGKGLLEGFQAFNRTGSFRKGAPFAEYKDFDSCVKANSDKDDPEAYCGKIKHETEDKKESSLRMAMKFSPEHLDALRQSVSPLDTPEARDQYKRGDFARADKVKDLDKRYRWDLYWGSGAHNKIQPYEHGYNDTHIDSALRAVVPPLSQKGSSSLVTQASTPKEMLPLVRHFVNENYDGEYRTQYSGPHKSGGHLFQTTLHGPEGPVVHTHVDPDGTLTDLTRSPSGAPTEEQSRWLKTHGSFQAEGARDWYSNSGNRVVLRAGDKRGLVHLHDWQSGEHMGHVQRSGTGYKALSDGGAHLGDFDDRDEAISSVFDNHLNNRYGGPEFGGPPKIASSVRVAAWPTNQSGHEINAHSTLPVGRPDLDGFYVQHNSYWHGPHSSREEADPSGQRYVTELRGGRRVWQGPGSPEPGDDRYATGSRSRRPFAPEAAGNDLNPDFDHGPVSVHYPPEDSADGSFTVHCQHCGPVSEHGDEDSAMVAAQEHNRLHPWNRSVRSSYTAAGPDNPYMPGAANPFVPNTGSPGGEDMQPSPTTGTMPDPGSAAVPDMDMGMVDPKTTRPRQKPSSNPNAPAMPATAPMGSGITQGFASLAARKAQEVARAVLATNPGLDPSQALRIAQATVERFPSMVRTSFSDSPELEHWQNDMAASQPQGDQGGGRGGLSMPSLPGIPGLGGGGAGAGGLAEEAAPLLAAANLLVTAAGIVDRIHGMDDGDRLNIGGNEKGEGGFGLSYYEYQPDGDNGQPAPGYLAGEYYLHHPSGKVENFHCSPGKKSGEFHAIQKRYQAEQISRRISDHIHGGGLGRQSGLHVAQQACPQCGAESYDPEVGICANCGYQGQAQSGGPGIGPYDPISSNG